MDTSGTWKANRTMLNQSLFQFQLYKNVFNPEIGPSLAFIGFVQPASGGVLTMSELQARWFAELCKRKITLPHRHVMDEVIKQEKVTISYRSQIVEIQEVIIRLFFFFALSVMHINCKRTILRFGVWRDQKL